MSHHRMASLAALLALSALAADDTVPVGVSTAPSAAASTLAVSASTAARSASTDILAITPAAALAATTSAPAAATTAITQSTSRTDWTYKILSQRNIFAKDRIRAREDRPADAPKKEEPAAAQPKTDGDWLLSGIAQKDGQLTALLENTKTAAVQRVHTGDSAGSGKIGAITLESIEYLVNTGKTVVPIGKALDGSTVAKLAEPTGAAASSPAPSSAAGASPEVNAVLERLRKRRQEEMRK